MTIARAAVAAALAVLAICALPAAAQDVRLSSRDGGIEISGTLLGYDGRFYRVDTVYGELTVDGSGVLCDGPGCPKLEDFVAEITISGAPEMARVLLPALVRGFARRAGYALRQEPSPESVQHYLLSQPRTGRAAGRFLIRSSSSDEGFADLLVNETDIVVSRREVRAEEAARGRAAGLGDLAAAAQNRVIALDALVPIVAPDNPLDSISLAELAQVFSGRIDNWADLGGPDAPVTVHLGRGDAAAGRAALDLLTVPAQDPALPGAVFHESQAALVAAVAADPFGIALASAAASDGTRRLALRGSCGFRLVASRRAVKTEDYPLTVPLLLYRPMRRLPQLGREFMAYIAGTAAQQVIRRAGFTDLGADEIGIDAQGIRLVNAISRTEGETGLEDLQDIVATLAPMRRLTTTFRYESGSARMDPRSRTNVQQLARALEDGRYDGRRLLLAGFSDGQGSAGLNRAIALRRAENARKAILDAAPTADAARLDIGVTSYGEAMPMACDDSDWGRRINRRVEVWVR